MDKCDNCKKLEQQIKDAELKGFMRAVDLIRQKEKEHWDKMGIVTPIASWYKWLESKLEE